jgi:hypothetical protein
MSSITFNPGKMLSLIHKGYRETKKLYKPVRVDEDILRELEAKYKLDTQKLAEIGIIPQDVLLKAGAA